MKKIISMVLLLVGVFTLTSCGKSDQVLNKILEKGEIVMITSPDYAPFEFIDESKTGDAQYVGSDIELMKFIASELGVTLKIQVADFDTTLASLALGTADLAISGYTFKQERADNYEMSDPYYEEGSQGILVLTSNLETYGTFGKLNISNVKIGAQSGTLQADYVSLQLSNATLESFGTIPNGIALLNNGSIHAIALASKVADIIISKSEGQYTFISERFDVSTEETQLYVLAKKEEVSLIEKINEILSKVKAENLYAEWDKQAIELAMSLGIL